MRKKKPFLIVFVAIVLACSIPISACATLTPFSSELDYYTYNIYDSEDYVSTSSSPWYDININNTNIVGRVHCRGGHVNFAFMMFIPFMGYYLVVSQENSMHIDFFDSHFNQNCFYHVIGINPANEVTQTVFGFYGDGFLTYNNRYCFQDVFFGQYFVFMCVSAVNAREPDRSFTYSLSNYELPTPALEDEILTTIRDNSGTDKPFPSGSATAEILGGSGAGVTDVNGEQVPTNNLGNVIPTYPDGTPAPTYPNGNPAPTEPDGTPSPTYPNGNPIPSTVYNGDFGRELDTEFSKLYSLVDDLDQASSIMESNAEIMSSHCDSTRTLLNDVIGWLPSSVVACLVCGCIMIIAVKITGSGKS